MTLHRHSVLCGKKKILKGAFSCTFKRISVASYFVVFSIPTQCFFSSFFLKFLITKMPTQVYFGMFDALLAAEELPEEFRDCCQVPASKSYTLIKMHVFSVSDRGFI